MGGGKTAVVSPLVIMNVLNGVQDIMLEDEKIRLVKGNTSKLNSVILTLPNKLIKQTLNLMVPLGAYLQIPIRTSSDVHFWMEMQDGVSLMVITDTTLKRSLCQRIKTPPQNLLYMFDEIDMIMNPLTSELNIPHDEEKMDNTIKEFEVIVNFVADTFIGNDAKQKSQETAKSRLSTMLYNILERTIQFSMTRGHNINYGHPKWSNKTIANVNRLVDDGEELDKTTLVHIQEAISKEHNNNILAIPFSYADVPAYGSEFNDPFLSMCFTISSILTNGLDTIRLYILFMIYKHAKEIQFTDKMYHAKYGEFSTAENRWSWCKQQVPTLRNNLNFIKTYLTYFLKKKVKMVKLTLSACGIDLVMSGNHLYRTGFTGTPEANVKIYDENPIEILSKTSNSEEDYALSRIEYDVIDNNTVNLDFANMVVSHIAKKVASSKYNVVIDVGSQFVGISPSTFYCMIIREIATMINNGEQVAINPINLEIVYWDNADEVKQLNFFGEVSVWNGTHTDNQIVFYDNSHTTGTDAVLRDDVNAVVTLRNDTRYRDFIQGIFRLRKITKVKDTKCTVLSNEPYKVDSLHKLIEMLNANENHYLAQQELLRTQQNAFALVRSRMQNLSKHKHLQETNIPFLRITSYQDYLLNILEVFAKSTENVTDEVFHAIGEITKKLDTPNWKDTEENNGNHICTNLKENIFEQEEITEVDKIKFQVKEVYTINDFTEPLRFDELLKEHVEIVPSKHDNKQFFAFEYEGMTKYVSRRFVSLEPLSIENVGALLVYVNHQSGTKNVFQLLVGEGIQFIDWVLATKPLNITIDICTRKGYVWFEYGNK
jgi:hypothetical protein